MSTAQLTATHRSAAQRPTALRDSTQRFKLTPPEPTEREVHETIAGLFETILGDGVEWFCYPAGIAELSAAQQARYSRAGLRRGLPDFFVFHRGVYCIELKRRGAQLSKTRIVRTKRGSPRILIGQDQMFPRLLATGAVNDIAVCYDVDEVLAALDRWGIPRRPTVKW